MTVKELMAMRQKNRELTQSFDKRGHNMEVIIEEAQRVADVARNASAIMGNLEVEFERKTQLNSLDIQFLFFATALQCARQYLLTAFKERKNDKETASETKGDQEEHSDRGHRLYHPSGEQIDANPVPFDAIYGARDFGLGLSGNNHRAKTLGHDPVLGWIFGTANIVTSTITVSDFQSYHVKTALISSGAARDRISNHAQTGKVLEYMFSRLFREGPEESLTVGKAIFKEWMHLQSDINSHKSLPIPIVNAVSPELAKTLTDFGIDSGAALTIMKQAGYAAMINFFIGFIHGMLNITTNADNWKLYQVRTRKILLYSNLMASTSNVIHCIVRRDMKKLDIGGLLVTLYRLVTDTKFIAQVKTEFILNKFDEMIMGEDLNLLEV
jgi:hypothetical protein